MCGWKGGGSKRKLVVFTLYIPPRTKAAQLEEITELLGTEIAAVKTIMSSPVIVVCGDFKGRDLTEAFVVDESIEMVKTGPKRGANTLDIVNNNVPNCISEATTVDPLGSEDGLLSDHRCVAITAALPKVKDFIWKAKKVRKRSDKADESFAENLRSF